MIFKDFDTLLSDGGGAYQQEEHFYCSAVKTMETKESTRTDTGGSAAAPHLQHFCHPRLPEHSQNFLPTWKRNHTRVRLSLAQTSELICEFRRLSSSHQKFDLKK